MKKTVILVGCGHLGTAMLSGWLKNAAIAGAVDFIVIDPKAEKLAVQYPSARFAARLPDNLTKMDAVVFAIRPQMVAEIIPQYSSCFGKQTLALSVAAGVTIAKIGHLLRLDPAKAGIVRSMPNLPSAIGQGVTAAYATSAASKDHKNLAQQLLAALGQILWIDRESDMDAITALSGSGPAYVFALCEAMQQAAIDQGLAPDLAQNLARQTLIGSAAYMAQDGGDAGLLKQRMVTRGGTTDAALAVFDRNQQFQNLIGEAIAAATARAKALSGE